MDISAPGAVDGEHGIECASGEGNYWITETGTSFAAPSVTGLVAYILSLQPDLQREDTTARTKSLVLDLGWSRGSGPLSLWNGEESTMGSIAKRMADNGTDGQCPLGETMGGPGSSETSSTIAPKSTSTSTSTSSSDPASTQDC